MPLAKGLHRNAAALATSSAAIGLGSGDFSAAWLFIRSMSPMPLAASEA